MSEFREIPLPRDWKEEVIGNDSIVKGRIGWRGYKKTDLRDSGPIVIGGTNVKSCPYLDLSNVSHISREKFDESPDIRLKEGDILVVQRGNGLGDTAYFDGSISEATINPTIIIISDFEGDPKFLFYYLTSPIGREKMLSLASGSSIPALYQNCLKGMTYPKPPLAEQHAISCVLGTLDEKIELNRRMNETLVSISRTIFKSWFIDFDPVRAKADGKQPFGMDEETAALFPSEFEDSELGEIPKGWKIQTIGSISSIGSGKRPAAIEKEESAHCSIPVFGGGGIMGHTSSSLYNDPIIITGRVGTLGKIFRISSPSWPSDNTIVIQPSLKDDYEFLHYSLKMLDFASMNRGSTQPLVTQTDIKNSTLIVPQSQIRSRYHNVVKPIFQKIDSNLDESRILSNIRDSLLPKLLSGEIRVPVEAD